MCSLEKSVLGKNCFFLLCFPARITTMQLTHNPLYEAVLGNNMRLCWCFLSDAVCGLVLASSACFSYRCLNMGRICGVKAVTPLFVPSSSNDRCLPVRLESVFVSLLMLTIVVLCCAFWKFLIAEIVSGSCWPRPQQQGVSVFFCFFNSILEWCGLRNSFIM